MNREVHVRFRESIEVKLLFATRLRGRSLNEWVTSYSILSCMGQQVPTPVGMRNTPFPIIGGTRAPYLNSMEYGIELLYLPVNPGRGQE